MRSHIIRRTLNVVGVNDSQQGHSSALYILILLVSFDSESLERVWLTQHVKGMVNPTCEGYG